MFDDDGGALGAIVLIFILIAAVLYVLVLLAGLIVSAGAVAGTAYGGFTAIRNYVSSFKENMIDSNKVIEV